MGALSREVSHQFQGRLPLSKEELVKLSKEFGSDFKDVMLSLLPVQV